MTRVTTAAHWDTTRSSAPGTSPANSHNDAVVRPTNHLFSKHAAGALCLYSRGDMLCKARVPFSMWQTFVVWKRSLKNKCIAHLILNLQLINMHIFDMDDRSSRVSPGTGNHQVGVTSCTWFRNSLSEALENKYNITIRSHSTSTPSRCDPSRSKLIFPFGKPTMFRDVQ